MKKLLLILIAFLTLSVTTFAKNSASDSLSLSQQMIMLGLYVYGLNQEAAKKIPSSDDVIFLSQSMIDLINEIRTSKQTQLHHKDIDELTKKLHDLKNTAREGPQAIHRNVSAVINECAKCHMQNSENL